MPSDRSSLSALAKFSCAALVGFLFACGKTSEKSGEEAEGQGGKSVAQSSLIGSESIATLDGLYDTVAARAARGDTLGLLRLVVNDSVYREIVWPVTPAYEPDREEVWNLVMAMHKSNSNKGLRRLMHDILQPRSDAVVRLPLAEVPVRGGTLLEIPKTAQTPGGIVLFGSALCLKGIGCQVLSYAQGGQRGSGSGDSTDDATGR